MARLSEHGVYDISRARQELGYSPNTISNAALPIISKTWIG